MQWTISEVMSLDLTIDTVEQTTQKVNEAFILWKAVALGKWMGIVLLHEGREIETHRP